MHPALRVALEQADAAQRREIVRVLVKVSDDVDTASLTDAGLRPGARLGAVLTGAIELGRIEDLVSRVGVLYVELSGPWSPDGGTAGMEGQ